MLLALLAGITGCSKQSAPVVISREARFHSIQPTAESASCKPCHQTIVDEWLGSQHASANRLVSDEKDRRRFEPVRTLKHGSFVTSTKRQLSGDLEFSVSFSNGPPEHYRAEAVIGVSPLIQYLVSAPGGRLQVMDVSYDPRSNQWFNAFGEEDRRPGEWGHWTGRAMNWNSQCAFCHMTGFKKNYDIQTDRYNSTWKAMGVSCSQCHLIHAPATVPPGQCPVSSKSSLSPSIASNRVIDTCASCHARREELFGTFKPGDAFNDHYRLTLPDQPGIFYADGQVANEDFEYGSFMMSRMGHKGVTCLNCHNPHSGKLLAPVENNFLCMRCHLPPGMNGAKPIDPLTHTFHKPGTPGSLCVDCHMPKNTYMARDDRRDHGFTSPDPRLTLEHGLPNACNGCHNNQTPEWADKFTSEWYGSKMERRARERARIVARFYEGDTSIRAQLLAMAESEEIIAWRAALVGMLEPWAGDENMHDFLIHELAHSNALVRSSAIKSLHGAPKSATSDPSALVRVDATMALIQQNPQIQPEAYTELSNYLHNISDQPAGALRQARLAMIENRNDDAEAWARKSLAWDPSAVPHYSLGRILITNGKTAEGISNLTAAATVATQQAEYSYTLALAANEAGNTPMALQWLEETVRRDPQFGRAWYNLGLAYAAADRIPDANKALQTAEPLMPGSAEPAYARATLHLRVGDVALARSALEAALQQDPRHNESRVLLDQLSKNKTPKTR